MRPNSSNYLEEVMADKDQTHQEQKENPLSELCDCSAHPTQSHSLRVAAQFCSVSGLCIVRS